MKILFLLLLVSCGCTTTEFTATPGGQWTLKRSSWGQRLGVLNATVNADGSASIRGYSNDGGNEMVATAVAAAVQAAISGAKP